MDTWTFIILAISHLEKKKGCLHNYIASKLFFKTWSAPWAHFLIETGYYSYIFQDINITLATK